MDNLIKITWGSREVLASSTLIAFQENPTFE